jgi:hypothetical protein
MTARLLFVLSLPIPAVGIVVLGKMLLLNFCDNLNHAINLAGDMFVELVGLFFEQLHLINELQLLSRFSD